MRMTRVWLIAPILLGAFGAVMPSTKQACIDKAKAETRTILSLKAPGKAAEAKAVLENVAKGLKDCGFKAPELAGLLSFQSSVNTEIDKLAKAGKSLNVAWYSLEFIKRLDALPVEGPEVPAKPAEKAEPAAEGTASDKAAAGAAPAEKPAAPAPGKIDSTFPIDDFAGDRNSKEGAGIPVVEFEELKTRAEVMGRSIENLTREVRATRVAVWVSVASLALSLAALAIGAFLLAARRPRPGSLGGGHGRVGR